MTFYNLAKLYRHRELLYSLTWRDIRVRYKQSVMGLLWAVLTPMLIVGAGALVRIAAAKWSGTAVTAQDMASVMVRAVVWSFVMTALRFGTSSLTGNASLVTKIAFPKEVFPLAAVLSSLFDLMVAAAVVGLVLLVMGIVPGPNALWVVAALAIAVLQVAGLTMILSAANLFFRDVKYLVEIVLTYAIFFTPVLYPVDVVGDWKPYLLLNPMAPILETISDAVVKGVPPQPFWLAYSLLLSFFLAVAGYWFFKQLEDRFAESI